MHSSTKTKKQKRKTDRKGRKAENKMQEIIGEVPMAEMSDFSTAMRSITQGTAVFTLTPTR